MNKYEILYIIPNDIEDDAKEALVNRFSSLVESLGGTVENVDKWGTKKYAYEVNDSWEGYYVLMNFSADPTAPLEIERQMRITDAVVRYLTIKK